MRPSLLTWLRNLAVGGVCFGGASFLSHHSRASSASGTGSSAAYPCCVDLFSLSLSLKLVCCQLDICNILLGACAAVCSMWCFGIFWTLLRVIVWAICAYLCTCGVTAVFCPTLFPSSNFRHHIDKKFPGCPHFTSDISLVELEMQISNNLSCDHHNLVVRWRNGVGASKFALSRSCCSLDRHFVRLRP